MPHSRHFLASILRIGLSGAGAQAVVFLSLPLLSRLYSPDSFGAWALIQSAALLLGAVATCRYELAVVLPKNHQEAASLLGLGFAIAVAVAGMAALAMPWTAPFLLTDAIPVSLAAWSIPLLVFISAINQLALAWCTRMTAFTQYGVAQLSLALFSGLLPAGLVLVWPDAMGLIVGTIAANVLVAAGLWLWIGRQLGREGLGAGFKLRAMLAAGAEYRAYPFYMTPYTLLGTLRDRAVYFLLGTHAGAAEVGLYAIAQRLANAPNSLVASALRPVFFQQVAQSADHAHIPPLIEKVMVWLVAVAIPPAVFFFFFPEELLTLLFGASWADSATFVMILAMPMLPLLLGNWMDRYFDALGRQRLAFGMELVFSVLAVGVLGAAFWLGASPREAVAAQSAVMAVYFTVWMVVLFRAADIPVRLLGRVAGIAALIALAATLVVGAGAWMGGLPGACLALALGWLPALRVAHRHSPLARRSA